MVFVDSCVWISYLNSEDELHLKALRVLGSLESEQIFVTNGVVFETVNYLFKKGGKKPASSALAVFESTKTIEIIHTDEKLWEQTVKVFSENELSLTDAQIVSAMKKLGDSELVSFDKHFDQVKWLKRIG